MAHFAQLSENNVVVRDIVVGNEDIIEDKPKGLMARKENN